MNMQINLSSIIEEAYTNIEEMDALKKRQKALELGIVPTQNTNWKAALKNKRLQEKAKNFRNTLIQTDKGKFNTDEFKEYGGVVNPKGNIENVKNIGYHGGVKMDNIDPKNDTYHIHPIYDDSFRDLVIDKIKNDEPNGFLLPDEKLEKKYQQVKNNLDQDDTLSNFRARPSGFPKLFQSKDELKNSQLIGDTIQFKRNIYDNNRPFRYDYVGTPMMASTPVSITRSTPNSQKTTFFAQDAAKYYDLNGRLKNKDLNRFDHPENVEYRNNLPKKSNSHFIDKKMGNMGGMFKKLFNS